MFAIWPPVRPTPLPDPLPFCNHQTVVCGYELLFVLFTGFFKLEFLTEVLNMSGGSDLSDLGITTSILQIPQLQFWCRLLPWAQSLVSRVCFYFFLGVGQSSPKWALQLAFPPVLHPLPATKTPGNGSRLLFPSISLTSVYFFMVGFPVHLLESSWLWPLSSNRSYWR